MPSLSPLRRRQPISTVLSIAFAAAGSLFACSSSDTSSGGATDTDGGVSAVGEAGSADSSASTGSDGGSTDKDGATSDAATTSAGPSAACKSAISAFNACGGTIPTGTYKVTSMCSPAVDTVRSPGCGPSGKTTSWFEEPTGAGTLIISGAPNAGGFEISGVLAKQHFVADAPQTCARSDCAFAKGNLYGTGPTGTCNPQGSDCHCEWTALPDTTGSGSGPFTVSGSNIAWQAKSIPYCVSGTTLTLDLSALFQSIPPLSAGTPFVASFTKQ